MKMDIYQIVKNALKEDQAQHDITSRLLIPSGHVSQGNIIAKENGLLCGTEFAKAAFQNLDKRITVSIKTKEGKKIKNGDCILNLQGPTRSLLAAERTALNFLGYLSGIATLTDLFVSKVKGTNIKILATRKTTPGNRIIEKYAVETGGGKPHRMNLSEMILIKDNHRSIYQDTSDLGALIQKTRKKTKKKIEVEVDNLKQFRTILNSRPDMILLDNMTVTNIKKCVQITKYLPKKQRPLLEASGGMRLNKIAKIAQTGVNRISVGALTHSHKSIDFSMELL